MPGLTVVPVLVPDLARRVPQLALKLAAQVRIVLPRDKIDLKIVQPALFLFIFVLFHNNFTEKWQTLVGFELGSSDHLHTTVAQKRQFSQVVLMIFDNQSV